MSAQPKLPSTREDCAALDRVDPLASLREQFSLPEGVIYLDGNSLGALPIKTAARIADAITSEWGAGLIRSWKRCRLDRVATPGRREDRPSGRRPARRPCWQAIRPPSTSLRSSPPPSRIQALDQPARRTIVSERGNFPTDLYIAEGLCQLLGSDAHYRLDLIDKDSELEAALAPRLPS